MQLNVNQLSVTFWIGPNILIISHYPEKGQLWNREDCFYFYFLFFFVIHNLEGLHKNITQYP